MWTECDYCPMAGKCWMECEIDTCDTALKNLVDSSYQEYFDAWMEYIGEYADS